MFKNEQMTEKLLAGLEAIEGKSVAVEQVDQFLQKEGVLVDVSIGRLRSKIELSPAAFGVDVHENESVDVFFKKYVKAGKLSFIPVRYEKKLTTIESSIRMARRKLAIGYDGKFMPIESYLEFKAYVAKREILYFEVLDDILANWESLMDDFRTVVQASLESMNAINRESLLNTILSSVPTPERYRKSFYIRTSVRAFPVMQELQFFDSELGDELRETLAEDATNTLYEVTASILVDVFQIVGKLLAGYSQYGYVRENQREAVSALVQRIKRNNILKQVTLIEIADLLTEANGFVSDEEMSEQLELVLGKTYGFVKELGVVHFLDVDATPYTEKTLEQLSMFA